MQWSTRDVGVPTVLYGTDSGKLLQVLCTCTSVMSTHMNCFEVGNCHAPSHANYPEVCGC